MMGRNPQWKRITADSTVNAFPPRAVAKDMRANADPSLPPLHAVIETPVLGHNTDLIVTPGYHRTDALWLHLPGSLGTCVPNATPTAGEIAAARQLLLDYGAYSASVV